MFEPSREQMETVERLALTNASVACMPLAAEGADMLVTVTGIPEAMGFTTRAPRVFELTIAVDGSIPMGVAA